MHCATLYQGCVRLQRDQLGGGDGGMSLHSAAASMGSMSRKRQSLIATEKLVENAVMFISSFLRKAGLSTEPCEARVQALD